MSEATTVPGGAPPPEPAEDPELILERLRDPAYLPAYSELMQLGQDASEGLRRITRNETESWRCEVFTREYVSGLADLMLAERQESGNGRQFTVLEVGAGDGSLSHFLRREFEEREEPGIHVVCSDSGDLKILPMGPQYQMIEYMEGGEAARKFNPDLVVESWMPSNLDLSEAFRAVDSVRAYILIGPADSSYSGRGWETWGVGETPSKPALFHRDGFDKERIEICPQLNWRSMSRDEIPSSTHIFRRQADRT